MDAESNVKEVMLQMHEKYAAEYEKMRDQIKELQIQQKMWN